MTKFTAEFIAEQRATILSCLPLTVTRDGKFNYALKTGPFSHDWVVAGGITGGDAKYLREAANNYPAALDEIARLTAECDALMKQLNTAADVEGLLTAERDALRVQLGSQIAKTAYEAGWASHYQGEFSRMALKVDALLEAHRWVPMSERYPAEGEIVNAVHRGEVLPAYWVSEDAGDREYEPHYVTVWYVADAGNECFCDIEGKPDCWMPLPEPPQD